MSSSRFYPMDPEEARRLAELEAAAQPHGPYAPAIVVGLLGLLVAVTVLLRQLDVLTIDLVAWGPWVVVGVGIVLLLVGAVGIGRRGR
ncbi:hypothetical protein [Arsenicicoccus sp. oral taxon 190]|uniref:hypothetical protein n=1 Tax=Arsenicicoccus sp. oral taxon 190 TaxID=1658671 RepID=UPI000679F1B8|nr:hypothetical protein [Arsenicicoccus sp. oral taxon 190]AKT50132.1 hypothetical protein ADJ73_00130 [Arsenicicoccus sp. oral taxon 190]